MALASKGKIWSLQRWNRVLVGPHFADLALGWETRGPVCPYSQMVQMDTFLSLFLFSIPSFQCFTCTNVLFSYNIRQSVSVSPICLHSVLQIPDAFFAKSLSVTEATYVGHPLCPSIWLRWYEEALCSYKRKEGERATQFMWVGARHHTKHISHEAHNNIIKLWKTTFKWYWRTWRCSNWTVSLG